jgi:hypothetical protein
MTHVLLILGSLDPTYLRIAEALVKDEALRGRKVLILDVTRISPVPSESYHRKVLHFFGFEHPGHDLRTRMASEGAVVLDVRDILREAPSRDLSESEEAQLRIAIESALITYFRTDRPNREKKRIRRLERDLSQEARQIHDAVDYMAKTFAISRVYVWNGRFPSQKLAWLAAKANGIETIHFEKGEPPSGAYVQPYAPQDRLASQYAVENVLRDLNSSEITAISKTWLARRAPSTSSSNEFSANWINTLPERLAPRPADRQVVGFFTSSQDEFLFLGPEWQLHEWSSQFEAFDALLTYFEKQGALCYLRIHPNLATKAHDCFVRERADLQRLASRHPDLIVVSHDNPVSSYAMLDVSDAVVVWDSTIGLEASARGIPVWTCAASRYGEVADVREVFGLDQVTAKMLDRWKVNSYGAEKYIAYLVKRDRQLEMSLPGWETWDVERRPFAVSLAALFVSGGNPSIWDALGATIDVWRHRSREFNKASLKAKRFAKPRVKPAKLSS